MIEESPKTTNSKGKGLMALQLATCRSHHIPQLRIDKAHLTIYNDLHLNLNKSKLLYIQSSECHECELQVVTMVADNCTVLVDTRWPVRVEIRGLNGSHEFTTPSCSAAKNTHHFWEGGEYFIFIQQAESSDDLMECHFAQTNSPSDTNIPIYLALGLAGFLPVMWTFLKLLYRRGWFHRLLCIWSTEFVMSDLGTPIIVNPTEDPGSTQSVASDANRDRKERVKSLDTFRGLSIVVMIFVNYHGGHYWFFQHSKWNGLTVADLVFPWFVYIMGTAMILSFQGQLQRGASKWSMQGKIVRRCITLFALGLVINSLGGSGKGVSLSHFRIPGVLQRFALTYLVVASVHVLLAKPLDETQQVRWPVVRDVTDFWPEWLVQLSLLALHIAITFGLSVPGCPLGYLGAGGQAELGQHANCTGGAAGFIDRQVFGSAHLDQHPSCLEIYHTVVPYDPEGLLGTLTSIFLCFLGLQAGKILFIHKNWLQRFVRFLLWGLGLCLLGGVLCKFSKDDGWIPINKNLWSLSFVLVLAGMAFLLLALFYLLIDVFKMWNGAPFLYPGMNPIVLYVGHELLKGRFPVGFVVPSTHADQLAMNLWGAVFWVIVGYYLHYKGIFITV
ncbi:hypothetical protein ACOMHN_063601 [Nucella lapillus]